LDWVKEDDQPQAQYVVDDISLSRYAVGVRHDEVWSIELSDEVDVWLEGLAPKPAAQAIRALDLLAEHGAALRMPHSRKLSDKLWELRFRCDQVSQRITYTIEPEKRIITLTTFRKQRNNERREVQRARNVLRRHQDQGEHS
jgi:hypothetical protein